MCVGGGEVCVGGGKCVCEEGMCVWEEGNVCVVEEGMCVSVIMNMIAIKTLHASLHHNDVTLKRLIDQLLTFVW